MLCRVVNTSATEQQEEEEEVQTDAEAAEDHYIDEQGNSRPLFASMSSSAMVRLKLGASVLSTCKIDKDIPAGCMGNVVGFRAAGDKSEDAGLVNYELPYGMTLEQALQDWSSVSQDRCFPYVVFQTCNGPQQKLVTPKMDTVDDSQGTVLCQRHQVPLVLGYGLTVHRAQGLTLDAVTFQIDGLFAPGQLYTALSRVRDVSNLKIQGTPKLGMVCSDQSVLDFERSVTARNKVIRCENR